MHGDIRVEIQAHAADTREAQQAACDEWRIEFNYVRPHEALDYRTPAEVYRPSANRTSGLRIIVPGGLWAPCCRARNRGLLQ